jgi:hypothetical protein
MVCNAVQHGYDSAENMNPHMAKAVQHPSFLVSTYAGSDTDSASNLSAESWWGSAEAPTPMGYMMHGPIDPQQQQMSYVAHQQQAHGYAAPMMQMVPMLVALIPPTMPMPVMADMQAIPVASPPGSMLQLPAGEKKGMRLEDLLPHGRRPTKPERENLGRKIFVGGLNPSTTTEDLRDYFSSFGVVADGCVIADGITKQSRGFGFVVFEDKIPEGLFDQQHIIDQRRCGVREYGQSASS